MGSDLSCPGERLAAWASEHPLAAHFGRIHNSRFKACPSIGYTTPRRNSLSG
jgi:hypothetical protein